MNTSLHQTSWSIRHNSTILAIGVCFQLGLMYGNAIGIAVALYGLSRHSHNLRQQFLGLSLSVTLPLLLYCPLYYSVLVQEQGNAFWYVAGLGGGYALAWCCYIGGYVYFRSRQDNYMSCVLWLWLASYLWEAAGVGFFHITSIVVYTPWEHVIAFGGEAVSMIFLWLLHYVGEDWAQRFLCLISLFLASGANSQPPSWLQDVTIYPEGMGHEVIIGDAIVSRRLQTPHGIWHASVGIGTVQGMSVKRHLLPGIEAGYAPAGHSRLMHVGKHSVLLLICHDVLFSDIWDEASQADAVVVISHLEDLLQTPIAHYIEKRASYIHAYTQKPVVHVDQHFQKIYA